MTENDVRLSPAAAVRLVASREIGTRLRSKAYRISTLAMLVLIVGGVFVAKLIGSSDGGTTVGVVGPAASLAAPLTATAQAIGEKLETSEVADEAAGRAKVTDGSLDALIVGDATKVRVVVKKDLDGKLKNALNVLAGQLAQKQEIEAQGGDAAKVQAAVANASVEVLPMEKPFDYSGEQLVLGYIAGLLIYISLMINGQIVAQGVVEEKTSRVVELLLATIRPWQLMAGKVLGIGVVGLIQMVLIGGLGIGAALGAGVLTLSLSAALGIVIWLIVWFLLGFFMYAIVFAGLGALVSRQEDVGGAVAPALTFVVAGYIVGATILPSNPGSGLVEVLSMIPAFAPTLMPMRLAMGGVPVWEAALSVVLVLATIPLLIWFAGRMYSGAVMRTGAKVKLRDALKAP
ncbi:ABC transporter permease [Amycolatopsis sp. cg5]|uniref:ABC transporter permease n=1 Tax=Amycolatopsis sp. cg5 TaxID=3238802 RepID=UPI003526BA5E